MKFLSQVVWSEGMYIGPHHFQAHRRYFEDSIGFSISALWPAAYGLLGALLDEEALRNRTLSLIHARGIFPDGLAFVVPESDRAPSPRPIADLFPPTRERMNVFLAVPKYQPLGANCAFDGEAPDARFIAEQRNLRDETTGSDERPVQVGRKNLRLLLETEPTDGMVSLPLARVMREGSGRLVFDQEFIPPCLQIAASDRLMSLLRRLIEILEERSRSLTTSSSLGAGAAWAPREIANFWMLHAVNSALATLRHFWISKRGHPEQLFLELSRLAGALCTFALDSHPRTLPVYDHDSLTDGFHALDRHIRVHLETIVPTNCLAIPLENNGDYFYEGDIPDTRCFARSRWLLGVRSNLGDAEVINRTAQLVKVCSAKFVGELVKRAMTGLALTHLPVPPPAVPAKAEMQYFSLDRSGPFWENIVQTRRVGIYIPGDLPNPELELLVILDT
jgi:type VI secretion system protein ImpJ